MKYKYIDINHLSVSLRELAANSNQFPFKICLAINQNIDEINRVVPAFDRTHDDVIKKYLNGRTGIDPGDEGYDECQKELNDLYNTEIEIDIKKVKESDIENAKLSLEAARYIKPMLEEGGDGNG